MKEGHEHGTCGSSGVADGVTRRFRILNIVADYSKFCPGQIVDLSLAGARLARSKDGLSLALGFDQLAPLHGLPEEIVPGKVRIRRILS